MPQTASRSHSSCKTPQPAVHADRLTGRPVLRSGLRQLLLGAVAVAITFGVGSLIGHHAG
jgi:hypothetical protein